MLWEELRADQFDAAREQSAGVCIIPIGCVESHGIHLPLGCDVMHVSEFVKRAAELEPVCVFPPIYFGEKSGAAEFPGTIIFPEKLIMDILEQCCHEIGRNGFKKILIVSGHGGNASLLGTFARSILQKDVDYHVYVYNEKLQTPQIILEEKEQYPYLTDEDIKILEDYVDTGKRGGHGCFSETGLLYDVCPNLISLENMNKRSGVSTRLFSEFGKHGIYTPFGWMGNYPDSYDGDYHEGMNERIAKAMGEKNTREMAEVFKFLKEETVSMTYHAEWRKKNFR